MEPVWLTIARKYIGTKEIKGLKHEPKILQWWKAIKRGGIKDDETPWCAGFVGGVLEEAGIISSRHEGARSYLAWGIPSTLCLGAIAVLSRAGGGGHVGFVVGKDNAGRILLLGGNQGDEVNIRAFDKSRIVGYRWPRPVENKLTALPVLSQSELSASEA